MRSIGDEAAVRLVQLGEDIVGILVSPWGELMIAAGRSGLVVQLNTEELLELAARCRQAAATLATTPRSTVPMGHA